MQLKIKKRKILIVFDDMIVYILRNKKLIINFIRRKKLNISPVFITESYFKSTKRC